MYIMGLTAREYVALLGGGHTLGRTHAARSGFKVRVVFLVEWYVQ
jgi:catalase (peroxidase I)